MSLISHADSQIIHKGYIYKKGVYNTSWKRRYFCIYNDRTVDYFTDKLHSGKRNKAKGTIYLRQIKRVEIVCKTNSTGSILSKQPLQEINNTAVISSICPPPNYSSSQQSLITQSTTNDADCQTFDEEYDAFNTILKDTKLNLSCDRSYAFALISSQRTFILSVDTSESLKKWIVLFQQMCQGPPVYDGHLFHKSSNQYFVLYANKVLLCYKSKNCVHAHFDVDLNKISYLKYDQMRNLEIAVSTNQVIHLQAATYILAREWYEEIRSVVKPKHLLKPIYDSYAESINVEHNGHVLKQRFIALYPDYMVILRDQKQLINMKQMVFFDKSSFRDFVRKGHMILIPVNEHIKIRKSSKKESFVISNKEGDRKWKINVGKADVLQTWMRLLFKNGRRLPVCKDRKKNRIDIEIESSFATQCVCGPDVSPYSEDSDAFSPILPTFGDKVSFSPPSKLSLNTISETSVSSED